MDQVVSLQTIKNLGGTPSHFPFVFFYKWHTPGFSHIADLYEDGTHLKSEGKYLEAVTHYATVFQADPHGVITSGLRFWRAPYSVDRAFAAKLASGGGLLRLSGMGHTPSADKPEHAVEVQLPFLQRVLGQFQIVPIVYTIHHDRQERLTRLYRRRPEEGRRVCVDEFGPLNLQPRHGRCLAMQGKKHVERHRVRELRCLAEPHWKCDRRRIWI